MRIDGFRGGGPAVDNVNAEYPPGGKVFRVPSPPAAVAHSITAWELKSQCLWVFGLFLRFVVGYPISPVRSDYVYAHAHRQILFDFTQGRS